MTVMTMAEWFAQGEELFGVDRTKWKFVCASSSCKRVQTGESVKHQVDNNIYSQRHGEQWPEGEQDGKKYLDLRVESRCYSPDCNWIANGLFTSGKLIIIDPEKPHDVQRKDNCFYVFWFEGERE